jgi:hypothetical protein
MFAQLLLQQHTRVRSNLHGCWSWQVILRSSKMEMLSLDQKRTTVLLHEDM